jgi:hypothetical protein
MKRLITILGLVTISSTAAFATNIKCEINAWNTSASGLMPSEKNIVLTSKILGKNQLDYSNCATDKSLGFKVMLCSSEAEFVGGYEVAIITENSSRDFPSISTGVFGTLRNGKGLIYLDGNREVLSGITQKLFDANIDAPTELGPDSVLLDKAIVEGVNKGALKTGETVTFIFDSCKIEN